LEFGKKSKSKLKIKICNGNGFENIYKKVGEKKSKNILFGIKNRKHN